MKQLTHFPAVTKPRLLVIGQAVQPTGYARVLHSILEHLTDDFEIIHFGINYRGQPLDIGWRVEPNQVMGDPLGVSQLPSLLERVQPDLVFMCHDPWLYTAHQDTLSHWDTQRSKVVYYCPIEWAPPNPTRLANLASVHQLVLYTEFGRKVVETAFTEVRQSVIQLAQPAISVIPHGLDTAQFYPLCGFPTAINLKQSRQQAREQLFPDRPELRDSFIILNANRNCPRKRIDLTLSAFAQFVRDKPDNIWLYLHMGMKDCGVDVLEVAERLGVAQRLLLTTTSAERPAVSDETLNLIYNACDVGLNTATGEGWGLVAFEHAATGAAQIMPQHPTCEELWQGIGLLVPLAEKHHSRDHAVEYGTVSVTGVADALNEIYRHQDGLQQKSVQAFTYATSLNFQWSHIALRWKTLFQNTLASRVSRIPLFIPL